MSTRTRGRGRAYWLWVTRPEFYLDDDGQDAEHLDPAQAYDPGGWWTCHKDTLPGDLILLWRTSPKKDIAYLLMARSPAYSLEGDPFARIRGWRYGCDYRVLHKFPHPLTLQDIRSIPDLQHWSALRASFQGSVFRIDDDSWEILVRHLAQKNEGFRALLDHLLQEPLDERSVQERHLERLLLDHLYLLEPFGWKGLHLYISPDQRRSGRQYHCKGLRGRIDLLCIDRKKRFVVIELKNHKADRKTFAQIAAYMGWVETHLAKGKKKKVLGLVLSRGVDPSFTYSQRLSDRVSQLDIDQVLGHLFAEN